MRMEIIIIWKRLWNTSGEIRNCVLREKLYQIIWLLIRTYLTIISSIMTYFKLTQSIEWCIIHLCFKKSHLFGKLRQSSPLSQHIRSEVPFPTTAFNFDSQYSLLPSWYTFMGIKCISIATLTISHVLHSPVSARYNAIHMSIVYDDDFDDDDEECTIIISLIGFGISPRMVGRTSEPSSIVAIYADLCEKCVPPYHRTTVHGVSDRQQPQSSFKPNSWHSMGDQTMQVANWAAVI